jgi:hypothetical protein
MNEIGRIVEMLDKTLDELPSYPCRVDEMTQREYEISEVSAHCVGVLMTARNWILNVEDTSAKRIKELEDAIRKHRNATGHEMCWENDEELWLILKDNICIDHKPPEWCEFMKKCAEYRASKDKNNETSSQKAKKD